jgi:hypothetical protein
VRTVGVTTKGVISAVSVLCTADFYRRSTTELQATPPQEGLLMAGLASIQRPPVSNTGRHSAPIVFVVGVK